MPLFWSFISTIIYLGAVAELYTLDMRYIRPSYFKDEVTNGNNMPADLLKPITPR